MTIENESLDFGLLFPKERGTECKSPADIFFLRFHDYIRTDEKAIKRYRKLFLNKTEKEIARFMRDVKNTYKTMVSNEGWSEEKLISMIDMAVEHRKDINQFSMRAMDKMNQERTGRKVLEPSKKRTARRRRRMVKK